MRINRGKPRRVGFTIIELLVVIAILGILVALVVSVGKYVRDEAKIKSTTSAQTIIMTAVSAFHEAEGSYPPDDGGGDGSCQMLVDYLSGKKGPGKDSRGVAAAMERLEMLPSDVFDGLGEFKDAYGKEMRYDADGGLNGPVIISAGPDGEFKTKDDIRSDGR